MLRYFLPFLIVTSIHSQSLGGFLDMKWQTFREQAKYHMINVLKLELQRDEDEFMVFKGGTYADNFVKFWSLYFFENRLYHIDVVLDTVKGKDVEIWSKTLGYLEGLHGKSNDFEKTAKNQAVIYWSFFDKNGELESLIQLNRTLNENLETRIQISYTYVPIFLKRRELE